MDNQCPHCDSVIKNNLLYKCVRCFTVYCGECPDAKTGRCCPKCGMSQRMLITPEK